MTDSSDASQAKEVAAGDEEPVAKSVDSKQETKEAEIPIKEIIKALPKRSRLDEIAYQIFIAPTPEDAIQVCIDNKIKLTRRGQINR